METGLLVVYTIVTFFGDDGEHHEKEVILCERPVVTLDEAQEFVDDFRRQQPPEDRPTRRLKQDDIYAVWTHKW